MTPHVIMILMYVYSLLGIMQVVKIVKYKVHA